MSLSNPKSTTNPAKKFIQWKGGEGQFVFWDKEQEKNIVMDTPLYIIVLDQLSCITGFNKIKQCGIFSNEVHDLRTEELNLRFQGGQTFETGLYSKVKGNLQGGKFTRSVYAALISKSGEMELVNFKFSGSSLGPWIEAKIGDDGNVIILGKNPSPQQNGSTTYYEPTFNRAQKREDLLELAINLDKELQAYFGATPSVETDNEIPPDFTPDINQYRQDEMITEPTDPMDDLPF